MGLRTLADLRDSVNLALGEKKQFDEHLDRWINDGIQELFVILDIEGRRVCAQTTTVIGQERYTLPSNLIATLVVTDRTNKRRLLKMAIENYEQLDKVKTGQPKYFARVGRSIYLWPLPTGNFLIHMFYIKEPDVLSAPTDITELTAQYDRIVHLLAVRSAMMDLSEFDKATFFYQTAVNALRAMPNEFNLESETPHVGIEVARSEADLTQPPPGR